MENLTLPIHETFQQTIQGEGFWAGTPADFIRLSGCPVACPWCDTGYADGGKDTPRINRTISELIDELRSPHVVISGGEPFIHKELPMLVEAIAATGRRVQIETSGAFWRPLPQSDTNPTWVTLSPKEHVSPQYKVEKKMWYRADEVKVVISSVDDFNYYEPRIRWTTLTFNDDMRYEGIKTSLTESLFLQPEWNDRDRTLPLVLDLLKQHPEFRLSLQTHKLIGVQ